MIKITPLFILRDLLFLLITYVYLLIILLFVGKLYIVSSLGFLVVYVVYVIATVITDKYYQKSDEDIKANAEAIEEIKKLGYEGKDDQNGDDDIKRQFSEFLKPENSKGSGILNDSKGTMIRTTMGANF